MAIKKSELYSSLWASCDALRGGMDASQYKDYILTLLFVKYVSDKFTGQEYADIEVPEGGSFEDMVKLIGKDNIGEGINKVIAKLAEVNNLRGVIDKVSFNDPDKLGKGKEMVEKLSKLVNIFRRPELDFSKNRTEGDDLIGDAYEYLMRKFATESGKSKGQFYTPAEVSRILAKVIGISKETRPEATIYDPACGSGSLLIRALEEAPIALSGYGQEKDTTTAGLAVMNTVLHDKATTVIKSGNTFSDPQYFDEKSDGTILRRFNYIVANPPFSMKNWTDGVRDYGRFTGYEEYPPEKNGDYAWLLHILKSLHNTGKAAVILPHGVLFRGNSEGTIRKNIIDRGLIKGIIGLPANLFYGTGIPACIIIIDKEGADERTGIFMIDASHDYEKDGDKNRLRERDIYKIVKTFNEEITDDPKYARFVPNAEIKEKNGYNLNLSRYIDSVSSEDVQNIEAHLKGGIPANDIEGLNKYWNIFEKLKNNLFTTLRNNCYMLNVKKDNISKAIHEDKEFSDYANKIDNAFMSWKNSVDEDLRTINKYVSAKELIISLSEKIMEEAEDIELIDKYDVYEVLLSYWIEVMSDDVYLLIHDGYSAAREISYEYVTKEKKEGNETITIVTDKVKTWEGKLIPKSIIIKEYFSKEQQEIDKTEIIVSDTEAQIKEMLESAEDNSVLAEIQNEKGNVTSKELKNKLNEIRSHIKNEEIIALEVFLNNLPAKKSARVAYIEKNPLCKNACSNEGNINITIIKARINEIRMVLPVPEMYAEDYNALITLEKLMNENYEKNKLLKDLKFELEEKVKAKYAVLTDDEIKELLVERKWYCSILEGINVLYTNISDNLTSRITQLADRYERTLPELESDVNKYECKVKSHLERMGFVW